MRIYRIIATALTLLILVQAVYAQVSDCGNTYSTVSTPPTAHIAPSSGTPTSGTGTATIDSTTEPGSAPAPVLSTIGSGCFDANPFTNVAWENYFSAEESMGLETSERVVVNDVIWLVTKDASDSSIVYLRSFDYSGAFISGFKMDFASAVNFAAGGGTSIAGAGSDLYVLIALSNGDIHVSKWDTTGNVWQRNIDESNVGVSDLKFNSALDVIEALYFRSGPEGAIIQLDASTGTTNFYTTFFDFTGSVSGLSGIAILPDGRTAVSFVDFASQLELALLNAAGNAFDWSITLEVLSVISVPPEFSTELCGSNICTAATFEPGSSIPTPRLFEVDSTGTLLQQIDWPAIGLTIDGFRAGGSGKIIAYGATSSSDGFVDVFSLSPFSVDFANTYPDLVLVRGVYDGTTTYSINGIASSGSDGAALILDTAGNILLGVGLVLPGFGDFSDVVAIPSSDDYIHAAFSVGTDAKIIRLNSAAAAAAVPEFSITTLLFAVLMAITGILLLRRKN